MALDKPNRSLDSCAVPSVLSSSLHPPRNFSGPPAGPVPYLSHNGFPSLLLLAPQLCAAPPRTTIATWESPGVPTSFSAPRLSLSFLLPFLGTLKPAFRCSPPSPSFHSVRSKTNLSFQVSPASRHPWLECSYLFLSATLLPTPGSNHLCSGLGTCSSFCLECHSLASPYGLHNLIQGSLLRNFPVCHSSGNPKHSVIPSGDSWYGVS